MKRHARRLLVLPILLVLDCQGGLLDARLDVGPGGDSAAEEPGPDAPVAPRAVWIWEADAFGLLDEPARREASLPTATGPGTSWPTSRRSTGR